MYVSPACSAAHSSPNAAAGTSTTWPGRYLDSSGKLTCVTMRSIVSQSAACVAGPVPACAGAGCSSRRTSNCCTCSLL